MFLRCNRRSEDGKEHRFTPEGFPRACELLAGNTADVTTLRGLLAKIDGM